MQIFIISWNGFHQKAMQIADFFYDHKFNPTIVYSDPSPDFNFPQKFQVIRRLDTLYFADKFKACLDFFTEDMMLLIHADCDCDDWGGLLESAQHALSSGAIGVWAPSIENTFYTLDKTQLGTLHIQEREYKIVANTDAIVLCIKKIVAERMKQMDYKENLYGWGIDWILNAYTFSHARLSVVDPSIKIRHNKHCGYSKEEAQKQRQIFLNQMSPVEKIAYKILNDAIWLNMHKKSKKDNSLSL